MKRVIFDCDGRLVHTQNAVRAAMKHGFTAPQHSASVQAVQEAGA
jgi:beta-phosphoglucomutase-like phosphatase (HAD superfamily)